MQMDYHICMSRQQNKQKKLLIKILVYFTFFIIYLTFLLPQHHKPHAQNDQT
jgi:hypothetical protein